jgi:GT2 family glycosyltransferase
MDVSVIIVNYNTYKLTIQSIQSVYQYTSGVEFEIILIDNASSDDSVALIRQEFPSLNIIANEINIGFGRANNEGIKVAKGEFVFLLNSDAFLTSNALLDFVNYMRQKGNQKVAICGGELFTGREDTTVSYGNLPTLLDAFSSIGFFKLYKSYHYKYVASGVVNTDDTIREVGYICGADMFIRKSILNEIGIFDSEFFLYFEETELSFRVKKSGFRSVILPFIKIIHLTNASQKVKNSFNYVNFFHYCRGRNLYFTKCHGFFYSIAVRMCYAVTEINLSVLGKRRGSIFKKLNLILFAK